MSRKHEPLPNKRPFDFAVPLAFLPRAIARANAGPGGANSIRLAACGQDDGHSRPLANANAGRMAGLRDTNREAWFVDNDAGEPGTEPGPAAGSTDAGSTDATTSKCAATVA